MIAQTTITRDGASTARRHTNKNRPIILDAREAANQGILMRTGEAFQIYGVVREIVLDKTGTLTEGKPVCRRRREEGRYPAQQESFATSLSKAWAASFSPSTVVRYGKIVSANCSTVRPHLMASTAV